MGGWSLAAVRLPDDRDRLVAFLTGSSWRLLDLDDIPDGAPLFDLRVADEARGQGVGTFAVRWLTGHLFASHPELHRIEATTRDDNVAMHRVLDRCGYRCEGRLRESWPAADGRRHDTLLYGILRTDPSPPP